MIKILNQHIDTLKFHYYPSLGLENKDIEKYNILVDRLISLKKDAQIKSSDLESTKDINVNLDIYKFNIMPKSVKGFGVIISNSDISIAFRKLKNISSNNPLLKVEFRAEFLARYGYLKCIKIVNDFVKNNLLFEHKITISEIHLATDIQGYEFRALDYYRFKTRARNSQTFEDDEVYSTSFGSLANFSGFVYGSGNYMLRVYNKSKEIQKFKNKGFVKDYFWLKNPFYDEDKTVWRVEFQIRREKLKKLTDVNFNSFDNYETILDNIPSLWSRAVNDFGFIDISDDEIFNMLRGYRNLKDGTQKLITKHYRYNILKTSERHRVWNIIKDYNGFVGDFVNNAFKIPKKGSLHYVSNSFKSVFSTIGKYYGSINSDTLQMAFKDVNELNKNSKNISLIDDVVSKQLDYFERINYVRLHGVLDVPDYKDLQFDILDILSNQEEIYKDVIRQNTKDRFIDIVNQNILNDDLIKMKGENFGL